MTEIVTSATISSTSRCGITAKPAAVMKAARRSPDSDRTASPSSPRKSVRSSVNAPHQSGLRRDRSSHSRRTASGGSSGARPTARAIATHPPITSPTHATA